MEAFIHKLFEISLTSAIMILAVVLIRILWKKIPSLSRRAFCIVWAVVGLRLILPFSLVSPVGIVPNLYDNNIKINSQTETLIRNDVEINYTVIPPTDTHITVPVSELDTAETTENGAIYKVLFSVWLTGTATLCSYCIVSIIKLKKRLCEAIPYRDGDKSVLLCDKVATPFILGLISPTIYLPFGLTDGDVTYILAHERSHIRRGDNVWRILAFIICSVHWFNPLVWLAFYLFSRDTEVACDERVFGTISDKERITYAKVLLKCSARRKPIHSICPVAFGESAVKERIRRTLFYKKPLMLITAVALAVTLTVCVLGSSQRPSEDNGASVSDTVSSDSEKTDVPGKTPEAETETDATDTSLPTVTETDTSESKPSKDENVNPSDRKDDTSDKTKTPEPADESPTVAQSEWTVTDVEKTPNTQNVSMNTEKPESSKPKDSMPADTEDVKAPEKPTQKPPVEEPTVTKNCATLGHKFRESAVVQSTCTEYGTRVLICERCGERIEESIPPTEEHHFEYINIEANCMHEGYSGNRCVACGLIVYDPDGWTDIGEHIFDEDMCCTVCGKQQKKIPYQVKHTEVINGYTVVYFTTEYWYIVE